MYSMTFALAAIAARAVLGGMEDRNHFNYFDFNLIDDNIGEARDNQFTGILNRAHAARIRILRQEAGRPFDRGNDMLRGNGIVAGNVFGNGGDISFC